MKNILTRTIEQTLKLWVIIAALIVGIAAGSVFMQGAYSYTTVPAYTSFANNLIINQSLIVFFLVAGIFLMSIVISSTTGLIASEVHEGTLRLLIAKPNNRQKIFTAKILGSMIGNLLAYLIALIAMGASFALVIHPDGNVLQSVLRYYPGYALYGVFIIFIMTGLSVLLSTIFKRKVGAMLPMLILMIVILGVFPIIRSISSLTGTASGGTAVWYDLNYHFASIFNFCLNLGGGLHGTTSQLQTTALLMNLFTAAKVDPDMGGQIYSNVTYYIANNSLLPALALLIYLAVSTGCFAGALVLFKKKDV